ncbi:hypothetical protein EFA46_009030 [Halarchaeum sp. CBA1220]|uniref:hypothetical protein n=1 Tax=Halarchaeum sp. CBA1220 TaxID=1853682 RepID=UPI0011CE690E|nr:hypothetical protein [Halarchaeum sp. CBA1220]QLC34343.1 hypothetical protein EFA46_009030 [Halarchaeum sp. CBA1220]
MTETGQNSPGRCIICDRTAEAAHTIGFPEIEDPIWVCEVCVDRLREAQSSPDKTLIDILIEDVATLDSRPD